jgi:hypothetical protein
MALAARILLFLSDTQPTCLGNYAASSRGSCLKERQNNPLRHRAQITSTVQNLNFASQKLQPLLEDFRKTSGQANEGLNHIESLIGENGKDICQAIFDVRRSLANVIDLTGRLGQTVDVNS